LNGDSKKGTLDMDSTINDKQALNEIALCLSGGGYRAAAFHLGTLDMLDQLGLLANVNRLSTVSGGTIVGMTYVVSVIENKSFGAFYKDFYAFLKDTNVIQEALSRLYTNKSPSGANDLSLIRSAASVYEEELFKNKTFGPLMDNAREGNRFKELIFNTTEFRVGNAFRFRASNNPRAIIGSDKFQVSRQSYAAVTKTSEEIAALPEEEQEEITNQLKRLKRLELAKQIRLSDIVAASSCFPAAFEPIRFPDDFHWMTNIKEVRETLESGFKDKDKDDNPVYISVPLMDGGIYDNQGLDSMLLTDDSEPPEINIFIVSDVSQRDDDVLDFKVKERKGWLSLNAIRWIGLAILISSLISFIAVSMRFISKWRATSQSLFDFIFQNPYDSIFVYVVPMFLAAAVAFILAWLYLTVSRKQKVEIAGEEFELWEFVRRLTMPDLLDLAEARVNSLVALTAQVFMKRIRSLVSTSVMTTRERRNRVAFNYIYDMQKAHPRTVNKDPDIQPSEGLKTVSINAEKVETTLWFAKDNKDDLNNLIVCGQASVCYSILRFLLDHHEQETKDTGSQFHALFNSAKGKWMSLRQNPKCFLDRTRP
jgi:predicted acylesterase/phospholipase RssA